MGDAPLEALLAVQGHDLVIDQLRHRRASLPERAVLRQLGAAVDEVDRRLSEVAVQVHDVERRQRRLEDEVDSLTAKRADSERRLYGGTVQAPRELDALSSEVASLARRTRGLEDELLELMEAAEPLTAQVSALQARREQLEAEAARLAAVVAEQEVEIDGLLAAEAEARQSATAAASAELLVTYERLRPRLDGVAVARLDGGRCSGCHLALPAMELDAVRRSPPGAVVRHEECGRILVR